MNKKILAFAVVAAFAVPFGAKLLAKKEKSVQELKEKLEKIDNKIAELNKSMQKSENLCEKEQTAPVCDYANEDISAKDIELRRLKDKRKKVKKELNERKGKKSKKHKKAHKKNK